MNFTSLAGGVVDGGQPVPVVQTVASRKFSGKRLDEL